ncbi:MAG: hypothetical protein L0196_01330 [candidate division Zixibacteria bacterium]|nr:hypothetical protein [candidate division Zixibacteria bacterium]
MKFFHDLSFRQKVSLMVPLHVLLLVIFVFFRYIDADEGLYLSAAREVLLGRLPYIDFMYVQTPCYPYFIAPFSNLGWAGLFVVRLLSTLAPVLTGLLLFSLARRLWDDTTAFAVWGFWILNGLVLTWGSVAKPAGWGDFFLFLGFWSLTGSPVPQKLAFFWSGLAAGMAANFRGFLAFPAAVWGVYLLQKKDLNRKKFSLWVFGLALALSFSLFFFLNSPPAFLFNNYTYHRLWGSEVVAGGGFDFLHRLTAFGKFALLPQNLVLYVLAFLGLRFRPKETWQREIFLLALGSALVLHFVFFISTPSMVQYYTETLPYLILLAGFGWKVVQERYAARFEIGKQLALGAAHLVSLGMVAYIFLFGYRPLNRPFLLSSVKPVIEHLRENGSSTDTLFSEWPGYAVLAGMQLPRGTETVGLDIAHLLTAEEKRAYHILDSAGADSLLRFKKVRWVVTGGAVSEVWPQPLFSNYAKDYDAGPIRIYRRKE